MQLQNLMKYILATKQYMTQVFDEAGNVSPSTVLSAGPVVVTQVKNKEKDGYDAVQVGFGARREKNIKKPQRPKGAFRVLREFRGAPGAVIGDTIAVSLFEPGEKVSVSALSKGKGFQGVVKRHGFAGGPRSHGQKHSEREPGSIGATNMQRVMKGMRMAGRMGGDRVTVRNLKILQVNPQENILVLKGAIPGRRGTVVEIRGI